VRRTESAFVRISSISWRVAVNLMQLDETLMRCVNAMGCRSVLKGSAGPPITVGAAATVTASVTTTIVTALVRCCRCKLSLSSLTARSSRGFCHHGGDRFHRGC
jgi:hypothetical protein